MRKIIILLSIALTFLISFSTIFDKKLDLNGDNANYLTYAHNIAAGHGYSALSYDASYQPVNHFPPAYSFVLSLFMRMGIDSIVFFKVLNGILMLLVIFIISHITARLSGNDWLGLSVGVFLALSAPMLHFATMVMSEMNYAFFSALCFLSLWMYADNQDSGTTSQGQGNSGQALTPWYRCPWFYCAILSAVAAYYFRTMAMACIFALLVFYLVRKEWKQALTSLAIAVVAYLPWVLRNKAAGLESRYFGTIMTVNPWRPEQGTISTPAEFVEKVLKNMDETVVKAFTESLFPFVNVNYNETSSWLLISGALLIIAVMIYGCFVNRKFTWLLFAYFVGNIGLFGLWHGGNGIRYVVPLIPWIVMTFYLGVAGVVRLIKVKVAKPDKSNGKNAKQLDSKGGALQLLALSLIVLALLEIPSVKLLAQQNRQAYPPAYKEYFDIAKQMKRHFKGKHVVVACRKPELFMMYAPDICARRYAFSDKPEEVIRDLEEHNTDYVILDALGYSSTGLYLYPAIMQNQSRFKPVMQYDNPPTYLLHFER
ncbi:MAG: hypothetical protein IJU35_08820 [Paludibacteraceae bacterium]|nr:hypothetical protein [Paludibacteraceae bacterium]